MGKALLAGDRDGVSDDELAVEACHDREAFLVLYDRYAPRIELFVRGRTYDRDDAADIVSTTFVRALTNIHTFHPARGTFAAWLFTVCRNVAADHYRDKQRRARLWERQAVHDSPGGPEELVLHRDEQERVRQALAVLTPDQRDAIALRFALELSFADVALVLGKSEAATRMLVSRAIRGLREELTQEEQT